MELLINYACKAGKIANRTCLNWTADRQSLVTPGAQFIFSYELANLLHENRAQLGLVRIEFDRELIEVHGLVGGRTATRVSRNTKRQYMVLHQSSGARRVIRARQYYNEGTASSEAKGLVRALSNYPTLEAAILVGVAGWRGANDPARFLMDRRDILTPEFVGIIDTAFTWLDKAETGPFVFALSFCRHQRHTDDR